MLETILYSIIIACLMFLAYWLGIRDGRERELLKNPKITITMAMDRVKSFNAQVDNEADKVDFLHRAFTHDITVDRKEPPHGSTAD